MVSEYSYTVTDNFSMVSDKYSIVVDNSEYTNHPTRSSTFAIKFQNAKITKELALLHPHNETTAHLETKDKAQTANKGYEIMAGENVI